MNLNDLIYFLYIKKCIRLSQTPLIDEITKISGDVIKDRAEKAVLGEQVNENYKNIDDETIMDMSKKIGINTLKYHDFSFLYQTNYAYNPEKMFEFKGNTGVYQMYCYCRIKSIIDKSLYTLDDVKEHSVELLEIIELNKDVDLTNLSDFNDLTDIDRDLLFHISDFVNTFETANDLLTIKPIMEYIKKLTSLFSKYVSAKNIKIIDAPTQKYRVLICSLCHKILDEIFEVLGFGKINFI